MRRRAFIAGMTTTAMAMRPTTLTAQIANKPALIGVLAGASQAGAARTVPQFMVGMRELGYQEGRTVHVEYRFADGRMDRLPKLARELVDLNPAVIVAANTEATMAAYRASHTIPIVCPLLPADAVALGLIASEAHPGGNITGLLVRVPGLAAKDVELVRELRPEADRIGVLTNPKGADAAAADQEIMAAGRKLSLEVITAKAGSPDEITPAFRILAGSAIRAVVLVPDSMFFAERRQLAALATAAKLPLLAWGSQLVADGALASYGVDLRDNYRRAAAYVDKILKGAKPGDLPVEFPTKVELAVNLRTAAAIGLVIPPTLLTRADEVIE